MNPGAERMNITLQRSSANQPWGFRLQGGTDFTTPLSVQSVAPGGVAQMCGLVAGDAVLSINNTSSDDMEHDAAKQEIVNSGNQVHLVIERGMMTTWRPKVTPLSELKPEERQQIQGEPGYEGMTQKTSLAANKQDFQNIGSTHNRSARPFAGFGGGSAPAQAPPPQHHQQPQYQQQPQYHQEQQQQQHHQQQHHQQQPQQQQQQQQEPQADERVPAVVHAQYNSPMGMYSADNVVDTYAVQSKHLMQDMDKLHGGDSPGAGGVGGSVSGTRSVQAPVTKPASEYMPKQQHMTCQACGMLCVGVLIKVKGQPMHPECFKCTRCNMSLKNIGYFTVEEKLYCEKCARFVAKPPEPNMVATPVYR